jgi:hypothetical protein
MEDLKCTNCGNQMSAAPKAPEQVSNTPQDGWKALPVRNIEAAFHPCEFQVTLGFKSCRAASDFMTALSTPPQQQEQSGEAYSQWKDATVMMHIRDLIHLAEMNFSSDAPQADRDMFRNARDQVLSAINSPATTTTASQESAPGQVTPDGYVSHDAYRGAMERAYLAEKRLHAAEEKLRKESEINTRLCRELNNMNGPTFMGEPVLSAPGQEAVAWIGEQDIITQDKARSDYWKLQGWKCIPLYLAPPTSTAIAAMVIKQAAEACRGRARTLPVTAAVEAEKCAHTILALTPTAAEAELEALMMDKSVLDYLEQQGQGFKLSLDWDAAYDGAQNYILWVNHGGVNDPEAAKVGEGKSLRAIVQSVIRKG